MRSIHGDNSDNLVVGSLLSILHGCHCDRASNGMGATTTSCMYSASVITRVGSSAASCIPVVEPTCGDGYLFARSNANIDGHGTHRA